MNPRDTLASINHNPLNMRPLPNGEKWQGQTGNSTNSVTGGFCVFENNVYGVRAAVLNMRSYVRTGTRTLRDVIYRWAPPPAGGLTGTSGSAVNGVDQNHTAAYLSSVCRSAGLTPAFNMTFLNSQDLFELANNRDALRRIIVAMNAVEAGGTTVDLHEVEEGISLALHIPLGYVRQDDGNLVRANLAQSETMVAANLGITSTTLTSVAGVAVPLISSVAGASWQVVAIIAGTGVLVLAGVAIYNLIRVRAERVKMHNEGIA